MQSALSKEHNISRKTVQNILKRKSELMSSYNENEPADRKRRAICKFSEIDAYVWEWFKKMRSQNKPIDGPALQAKALEYASNGWLFSWRNRHNVVYGSMSGEGSTVLTDGYAEENIYNLDETGLLFRGTPRGLKGKRALDCVLIGQHDRKF